MSQPFIGITQALGVHVVDDAHEATRQGHFYRPPVFKPLQIEKVVVVKRGTQSGKSTVDLVFVDEHGQKYVTMLTGALLRSIPTEFV